MAASNESGNSKLKKDTIASLVKAALKEDIGRKDVTTDNLIPRGARVDANISAKQHGVVCGLDFVEEVFYDLDRNVRVKKMSKDGDAIEEEKVVCFLSGPAQSILKGERTALNFLGKLSGIATLTNQYVEKVKNTSAKIMDTRKTTPLLREIEKYAVRCGGGYNHRMGLYDQVLIKDNHLLIANKPLKQIVRDLKKTLQKGVKIEIEADSLKMAKEALTCGADIVMLDNMSITDMKEIVKLRKGILLEASGNVTLDTVSTIAQAGVDRISIGALTHSAPHFDFSLEII